MIILESIKKTFKAILEGLNFFLNLLPIHPNELLAFCHKLVKTILRVLILNFILAAILKQTDLRSLLESFVVNDFVLVIKLLEVDFDEDTQIV